MIARSGIAAVALAAACMSFAPMAEGAEPITVKVVMSEYKFAPDHLELRQGVRYRLRLENSGGELHEFTAATFFKSVQIENPELLNADHTDVVLQPHESKEVVLTPRRKGSYTLVCADHDWEGMVGKITVK